MSSNLVRGLVQRCRFQRVEMISRFLIIQYFFSWGRTSSAEFAATSCCLVETVLSVLFQTQTSVRTSFCLGATTHQGSLCCSFQGWQLIDLELKQRCIVSPDTGEERSSSRVSRSKSFTSFLLCTNELINYSDEQWANKLSTNLSGHSSGRKEPSASGSACLSSQVLLGWNQLRAPVLTHQRDHLQVRMETRFPSARVLQHTEFYWGIRAHLDVFSSKLEHYSP